MIIDNQAPEIDNVDDVAEFSATANSMKTLGFAQKDQGWTDQSLDSYETESELSTEVALAKIRFKILLN